MTTADETTNHSNTQAGSDAWSTFQPLIDTITKERDTLASHLRQYEGGKNQDVEPVKLLQEAKAKITLAWSAAKTTKISSMTARELIADYWQQVAKRKNVVETGFGKLNNALSGGLEAGRLVGVLGAPNCGKTSFTHQMADTVANKGRPVLYVTSEDTPSALFAKTIARRGRLNYNAVLKGWETEKANIERALAEQLDQLSSYRLRYLDATAGRVFMSDIKEAAERHFTEFRNTKPGGPGVLVIDYLQRLARSFAAAGGGNKDLRHYVTELTEDLKEIAGELDCTVVVIAAQSRAGYSRSETMGALASAKESGDIEYTCDVLLALTEDKDKHRVVPQGQTGILLHVDKNRQGEKGAAIPLDFWPSRQEFTQAGGEA